MFFWLPQQPPLDIHYNWISIKQIAFIVHGNYTDATDAVDSYEFELWINIPLKTCNIIYC